MKLKCVVGNIKNIDLIRSKGGKANSYDANGRNVEQGDGDLND